MNLVFAGTPDFAVAPLRALLDAGHKIPLVLTQPDRPSGRGMRLLPSPVKQLAIGRGLRVFQPPTLKLPETQAVLREVVEAESVDLMIVVAYGLILPQAVLDMPKRGCLNIHGSLLPRWRGAAPIPRAIQAGDHQTGVGIMIMEAGLDTGPVLLQEALPISDGDTAASLHDKLSVLGASLIVDALSRFDMLLPVVQSVDGVTYAHKLEKGEGRIDFGRSAVELSRMIRAFDPFPGTVAMLGSDVVKIWGALPVAGVGVPGEVLAASGNGIVIACGEGALCVTELQKAGGKRLGARDFLSGTSIAPGVCFAACS